MLELPLALSIIFAGVLGLLVGSFLNVVILRVPTRMAAEWQREARDILGLEADPTPLPPGIVRVPSHCMHCQHPLSPLDNIPVLSWLWLRGRCRYCQASISAQYPLVELLSGVLCMVIVWKFGPTWVALAGLALTWTLIALAGIDLRTQLLPDQLTLPLLWLGLVLALIPVFVSAPAAISGGAEGSRRLHELELPRARRHRLPQPVERVLDIQAAHRQGRHGPRRFQTAGRAGRVDGASGAAADHPVVLTHRRAGGWRDDHVAPA